MNPGAATPWPRSHECTHTHTHTTACTCDLMGPQHPWGHHSGYLIVFPAPRAKPDKGIVPACARPPLNKAVPWQHQPTRPHNPRDHTPQQARSKHTDTQAAAHASAAGMAPILPCWGQQGQQTLPSQQETCRRRTHCGYSFQWAPIFVSLLAVPPPLHAAYSLTGASLRAPGCRGCPATGLPTPGGARWTTALR